jgi:hypothetical protein
MILNTQQELELEKLIDDWNKEHGGKWGYKIIDDKLRKDYLKRSKLIPFENAFKRAIRETGCIRCDGSFKAEDWMSDKDKENE